MGNCFSGSAPAEDGAAPVAAKPPPPSPPAAPPAALPAADDAAADAAGTAAGTSAEPVAAEPAVEPAAPPPPGGAAATAKPKPKPAGAASVSLAEALGAPQVAAVALPAALAVGLGVVRATASGPLGLLAFWVVALAVAAAALGLRRPGPAAAAPHLGAVGAVLAKVFGTIVDALVFVLDRAGAGAARRLRGLRTPKKKGFKATFRKNKKGNASGEAWLPFCNLCARVVGFALLKPFFSIYCGRIPAMIISLFFFFFDSKDSPRPFIRFLRAAGFLLLGSFTGYDYIMVTFTGRGPLNGQLDRIGYHYTAPYGQQEWYSMKDIRLAVDLELVAGKLTANGTLGADITVDHGRNAAPGFRETAMLFHVETIFDDGHGWGFVYTNGLHALGLPEILCDPVPR